jgi:predicted esterase
MVRFAETRAQMKLLENAGLNLQFHQFEKAHTIAGEEELDLIREFVRAGYAVVGQ